MGNGQSVSEDDEHDTYTAPEPYHPHHHHQHHHHNQYDDEDDDDDYGPTDLENKKRAVEKRVQLPPHPHGEGGGRTTYKNSNTSTAAAMYIPSSRKMKSLVDNDDDHNTSSNSNSSSNSNPRANYNSSSSSVVTEEEEDNSLVTYDEGTEEGESTRDTSGSHPEHCPLYDDDDVTAMTDMAHDGDDEATTKEERQKRARWSSAQRRQAKEQRRQAKEQIHQAKEEESSRISRDGCSSDDEEVETIMIIDADEEYSRSTASASVFAQNVLSESDIKSAKKNKRDVPPNEDKTQRNHEEECNDTTSDKENGNEEVAPILVEGIVEENVDSSIMDRADFALEKVSQSQQVTTKRKQKKKRESAPEEVEEQQNHNDDEETNDKENGNDTAVSLRVEGVAREKAESIAVARTSVDRGKVIRSLQAETEGKPSFEQDDEEDEGSVATIDSCSTNESKVHELVPAMDDDGSISPRPVVRSSKTTQQRATAKSSASTKRKAKARIIVPAKEVTREGVDRIAMKIVIASDVETSPQHKIGCMPAQLLAAKTDVYHSIPVAPSTQQLKETPTSNVTRKHHMTVVVASDVETSPQHRIGCMPVVKAAAKTDVFHSFARQEQTTPNDALLPNPTKPSRRRAPRNVPVVVNGKIVGSSATWTTVHKPTPETPKRTTREEFSGRQAVQNPTPIDDRDEIKEIKNSPPIVDGEVIGKPKPDSSRPTIPPSVQRPQPPFEDENGKATSVKVETQTRANSMNAAVSAVAETPNFVTVNVSTKNPDEEKAKDAMRTKEKQLYINTVSPRSAVSLSLKETNFDSVAEKPVRISGAEPDGRNANAITAKMLLPPSPNRDKTNATPAIKSEAEKKLDRTSPSTKEKIAKAIDALTLKFPETEIKSDDVNPTPRLSRTQAKASTKEKIAQAIDALTLKIPEIEIKPDDVNPTPTQSRTQAKASSPKTIPKITSMGSSDLPWIASEDFEGIDFVVVEQYEEAFNALLEKYPEFTTEDPKLVETLRIAKLQKLLSVTLEVESELEDYVRSLTVQKAEMTAHYHIKLLEAAKKKASREIMLQQALDNAQRDTRVLEGQLIWRLISMCDIHAKHYAKLKKQKYQQNATAADPLLASLPENVGAELRQVILDAAVHQHQHQHTSESLAEEQKQRQQLQVDNAFLNAQATALEKKLAYVQAAAKKHAWVDSVFRRLDSQHLVLLKKRFDDKLGLVL